MPPRARTTLDDLIRLNPDFRSPEGHLLYARALEAEGNFQKALEEYQTLAPSYPGRRGGRPLRAAAASTGSPRRRLRKSRASLLEQARIAPAHYRKAQKSWLDAAQRLL